MKRVLSAQEQLDRAQRKARKANPVEIEPEVKPRHRRGPKPGRKARRSEVSRGLPSQTTPKSLILLANVNLGKLSRDTGISISMLSLVFSGRRYPSIRSLHKIAAAIRKPVEKVWEVIKASGPDGPRNARVNRGTLVATEDPVQVRTGTQ